MTKELKQKWVAALRSGEFKQGEGCLYDERTNSYCCLGVCAVLMGYDKSTLKKPVTLPDYSATPEKTWEAIVGKNYETLIAMNDKSVPFTEIADYIDKNY
jgi:hypothetical protein